MTVQVKPVGIDAVKHAQIDCKLYCQVQVCDLSCPGYVLYKLRCDIPLMTKMRVKGNLTFAHPYNVILKDNQLVLCMCMD